MKEISIFHRNTGNLGKKKISLPDCFRGQRDISMIVQVKTVTAELEALS